MRSMCIDREMLKEEYGIELIYFIIFVVGFLLKMKKSYKN